MEQPVAASDEIEPGKLAEIRKKIAHESILLAKKITKINKKNKGQERFIVLTHTNLYNLEKSTIKRTIRVPCIEGVSISLASNEIVLHVPSEYDYRYDCGYRDELLHWILHAREVHIKLKDDLMVFLLPDAELESVTTTQDDVKKEKRRQPSVKPKYVRLDNVNYILYNQILSSRQERLLYIAPDTYLNFKKREFSRLVKVGAHSVCELYIVRCNVTQQKLIVREHRKSHLTISSELFHERLFRYQPSKFWARVVYAVEKETLFELSYLPYIGDLYGELNALNEFDEDVVKHIAIRLVLALENLEELYPALSPENVLVDAEGNTYLSYFNMYIRCSIPYEYLSPEELLSVDCKAPVVQYPRMANIWKLGVLLFELAYGVPPFGIQELLNIALGKADPVVKRPEALGKSAEFHRFLEALLRRRPEDRLGFGSFFEEIRGTYWLRDMNWEAYRRSNVPLRKYFKNLRLSQNYVESSSIEYLY